MTKNKQLWLIPYAHLDTQWRWEYPTTIKKYIKNTLDENLYLFDKYPDYVFNFTGALRYAMMKDYYPEKYEKAKALIKSGRWCLAGTCLDETDTLSPSVESMIRNILYGDRFAQMEFGKSSRDYMIPDCFGFPGNMPSVLAHCGIHGFSSQKLTWGSAVGIPFEIGIWEGPDGNGIVSALNPGSYNWRLIPPIHKNPKRLERLDKLGEKNGIWKSFQYYGVGDIGGAPTKSSVRRAVSSIKNASTIDPELIIKQGSSDQFFSEITDEEKSRMDSYSGDLLLVNHSAGSLTSAAIMKRWNRKNEQMAFAAEAAALIALWKSGLSYPSEKIRSAWYRTIGNQMHDILPGTCTPIAYEYSQNDEVVALKLWGAILEDSAQSIAPFVKGTGEILVFNPLGEYRKDPVDIALDTLNDISNEAHIMVDADGNKLPVQIRKDANDNLIATFIPELKPFSWSRFSLKVAELEPNPMTESSVSVILDGDRYRLENSNYMLSISIDGKIESIIYKKKNIELLKKPLAYEFQSENPSAYPAWNMDWDDRKKAPYLRIEGGGTVSVIENGPLRCTIQISIVHESSTFIKEVSLSQDSEIIEFIERIQWRHKGCSFKLAVDANIDNPNVNFNWETSRIERGINNEKLFEMPSRYWVDMSGSDFGISLIEDSKYGYDRPKDNVLRLTLLYTPSVRKHVGFKDQEWQDWGEHTIRYALFGHNGNFKNTDHLARRFNQKVRSFTITDDMSSVVKEDISLLEISNSQLGILALKKAEDSEKIVLRLYERYGSPADADVRFNTEITDIQEINGLEEPLKDISHVGNSFKVQISANGIKSFLITLKDLKEVVNDKQESINLEYNVRLLAKNKEHDGLFPIEMISSPVQAGSISYKIALDTHNNSLECAGQFIPIPRGYNTLSILAGSWKDTDAQIQWVNKNKSPISNDSISISSMIGYIGQWDTRKWKKTPKRHLKLKRDYIWLNSCVGVEPGYIKRGRLEWYLNHTHKNGRDEPYQYGYMYSIHLNIPENAEGIILPDNKDLNVFAMTASQQDLKLKSAQALTDKFDF